MPLIDKLGNLLLTFLQAKSGIRQMEELSQNEKNAIDARLKLYEIYRQYVVHEDNLTNYRMSWLLTIHGFLYATYGFTIQKKLDIAANTKGIDVDPAISAAKLLVDIQIDLFLLSIAFIGIFISYVSWRALGAAIDAVALLNHNANSSFDMNNAADTVTTNPVIPFFIGVGTLVNEKSWLPQIVGGGMVYKTITGLWAPRFIPLILIGNWLILVSFLVYTLVAPMIGKV